MKQNKAFTLIEMLAVVAILGVATLVIAPSIVNILKKSEDNKYNNYLEDLFLAAESYVQTHTDEITVLSYPGGTYTVSIKTLRDNNLVKKNLINPKTKENTLDTDGIKITVENDLKHKYEFIIDAGDTAESCFTVNGTGETITGYTCTSTSVNVKIPSKINGITITSIGASAFRNNNLTSITIPSSVTTIGNYTFSGNQLISVNIPNSVTTIGNGAFRDNDLTSITIPSSVTTIGSYAFHSNKLKSITISSGVTSIGSYAFNDNQLPDNQAFIYARNANGTENKSKVIGYGGKKRDNVVIPSNVTEIGYGAFDSSDLTSITIPSSVTTIGNNAFFNNQLTSVTIPSSVTIIGNSAFLQNQLTSVTIPSSVTIIGTSAFANNKTGMKVIVNKASGSISGSPWGASSVEWTG